MGFELDKVFGDMLAAAEGVFRKEWPKVKDAMEQVLADEREALKNISEAYMSGALTDEELQDQLEGERDAFEAGVAMCKVKSKVTIQKAVNAALKVLEEAVKAVV
ncbi:hypothetical protein [Geotalea toluenoxydans]